MDNRIQNPRSISLVACQEGVKKAVILEIGSTSPNMLKQLRQGLNLSLSDFGVILRRAIDPRATKGFTRQYVSRLEHGQDAITPEIESAFWNIAAVMDDVPAAVGGAVTVSVLVQPGQIENGSLIKRSPAMRSKHCARPGCAVVFIGPGKYHDDDCREAYYKETRR